MEDALFSYDRYVGITQPDKTHHIGKAERFRQLPAQHLPDYGRRIMRKWADHISVGDPVVVRAGRVPDFLFPPHSFGASNVERKTSTLFPDPDFRLHNS